MKTKFITACYSMYKENGLLHTNNRYWRFRLSLLSLLNLTTANSADFVCYTSEDEVDDLRSFFYDKHGVDPSKIQFKVCDFHTTKYAELFRKARGSSELWRPGNFTDLYSNKLEWCLAEESESYDYYYWIDAGLCHDGLIPNKYRITTEDSNRNPYNTEIFNPYLLENMISRTKDRCFVIVKDNRYETWCRPLDDKYWPVNSNGDRVKDTSAHIVGGLFGGKISVLKEINEYYQYCAFDMLKHGVHDFTEEQILSWIFPTQRHLFTEQPIKFETWSPDFNDPRLKFINAIEELMQ